MTHAEAERALLALPRFADAGAAAYRPGLERMRALLADLGDPHEAFRSVHVAGTNGKGSTASLAAAVASAGGDRVGLHTSPHLVSLRERMRVDGVPAAEAWLASAVGRYGHVLQDTGPSFFEATVALSFLYFAERAVDLAVVEVGLGGRLDATNVLTPVVSVVTHVGLDHTDLLGDTPSAIAREKAGIATPGAPLLHAVTGPAQAALEREAERRGAPVEAVRQSCRVTIGDGAPLEVGLQTPVRDYGTVTVGLPGGHQAWNAALAVRAVETAVPSVGAEAVRAGLREVATRSGLRGRGEPWAGDPRVTLDVAHNPDGWHAALAAWDVPEGGARWLAVGLMADKDAAALGALAAAHGAHVLAVGLEGDRALSAEALAQALRAAGADARPVEGAISAVRAFERASGPLDRLLVTGSHGTVAAVLEARTPDAPAG